MVSRIVRRAGRISLLAALALSVSLAGGTAANAAATGSGSGSSGSVRTGQPIPLAQPGAAVAAAPAKCTDAEYGGTFYCGYGERFAILSSGVEQLFVVGTDYAVWTRWHRTDGSYSSWTSLGGEVNHTVSTSNFVICYPANLHVNVKGTNGSYYYKTRFESSGSWSTSWQLGVPCFA